MPIYYDPGANKKRPPTPPKPDETPSKGVTYKPSEDFMPQWLQNFMFKPDKPTDVVVPGYGKPMQINQPTRQWLGQQLVPALALRDWFKQNNRTAGLATYYQPAGGTAGPYSYPADLGGESYFNAAGVGTKPPTTTDPNYGRGRGTNRRDRPDWAGNYDYSISQMGYGSGGMFGTLPKSTDADLPPNNPPPPTSGGYPYDYYGWGGGGGGGYSYGFGSAKKSWYSDLLNWRI